MKTSQEAVLLGIGGWEHDVLSQCLYGDGVESAAERLARYAGVFDVGEVRATFWDDTLGAEDARAWAEAVSGNTRFGFVVKLQPGCGGYLQLAVKRFANPPRAGLPWQK